MRKIIFSKDRLQNDWFDSYSWFSIAYPKGLAPRDYLDFAELDFAEGKMQRNLINSISNAKRALHLEVETLCDAFGLAHSKKKAKTFPQKLEFIGNCGLVKQRLLAKLNETRNSVEHEYYVPTEDEVENFIDAVELFVDAMRLTRSRYPCDVKLNDALDDSGEYQAKSIGMDFRKGLMHFEIFSVSDRQAKPIHQEISVNDADYFLWVSFILRNNY